MFQKCEASAFSLTLTLSRPKPRDLLQCSPHERFDFLNASFLPPRSTWMATHILHNIELHQNETLQIKSSTTVLHDSYEDLANTHHHQDASISAQKRSALPDRGRTSALCMRCAAHFGSCNHPHLLLTLTFSRCKSQQHAGTARIQNNLCLSSFAVFLLYRQNRPITLER